MKKHLISTSAIALGIAMAAPVAAQEWDVGIGGYMRQHVGYRDISGTWDGLGAGDKASDWDGVQFHSKSQIHFNPTITLDNGLTFGATVKLQGENKSASQQIDEGYMTISSDTLGQIIIGSTNSAGYKLSTGAPGVVSMYINSSSISTFIPYSNVETSNGDSLGDFFRQAVLSSSTEVAGNNDVQRLTYFTPSFNGLTLGVSYAATGDLGGGGYVKNYGGNPRETTLHDIFDIGANYNQTFGTTSVELSARYGTGKVSRADKALGISDPSTWGVGAQIGFSDFLIGASYGENNNGMSGPANNEGWSLGATYDMPGPWAFEAQTYQGKVKTDVAGASRAKYEAYQIGASRDMGPGVSWDVYVSHVKADNGEAGGDRQNIKGTVLGTGVNISF